ncbi:hypothetical protein EV356DRAFT_531638 [Viridothelium virens]|uniref:DNA-directed RNA polymerase II subunit RPB9-like zinc ribbon domain-containing protein n=1 Tax=Viridothelium virens TaxID=1048519 RepID=A0A6A6HCM1_VIRVR|nr:hypothetical protein EV356DRAFT_531638 [Viridothelium virens]
MSASPAPKDEDQSNRVAFRFCRECSNMLYPRENSNTNELVFACGMCDFEDKAVENKCVWRHELSNTVGETAGITQDVSADPSVRAVDPTTSQLHTLSLSAPGPSTIASTTPKDQEDLKDHEDPILLLAKARKIWFCTGCGQLLNCIKCGRPTSNGLLVEATADGGVEDTEDLDENDIDDPKEYHDDDEDKPAHIPSWTENDGTEHKLDPSRNGNVIAASETSLTKQGRREILKSTW